MYSYAYIPDSNVAIAEWQVLMSAGMAMEHTFPLQKGPPV